jgi:hypothetical protein
MPMISGQPSSLSEFSKGRAASESSTNSTVRNLIMMAGSWLGKLASSGVVRVLMVFFVGFAAGIAWQS